MANASSPAVPAVALEATTQAFLGLRLADRIALSRALQTSSMALWDPYPYRNAPMGTRGYPSSDEVANKILNEAKKAVGTPSNQTKGSTVSLQQQHALLESYRRASQTGRMRKYHQLRVWVNDVTYEETRQLAFQANMGPVTARRQAQGLS